MSNSKPSLSRNSSQDAYLLENQIKNPDKLKMLILSGSQLVRQDFLFICRCLNLIKLDLSNNGLTKFPKDFTLINLHRLSFLNLHNNQFRNIEDLKPVFETTMLVHLTLHTNPLEITPRVQHFIINTLKRLRVFNDRVIFEEERLPDVLVSRPRIHVQIADIHTSNKNGQYDEKQYLRRLESQYKFIERMWVSANPIVKLQRLWRFLQRERLVSKTLSFQPHRQPADYSKYEEAKSKAFASDASSSKKTVNHTKLAKIFEVWKNFYKSKSKVISHFKRVHKEYMVASLGQYIQHHRNTRVKEVMNRFMRRIRERVKQRKAVATFAKHMLRKVIIFQSPSYSFYQVSGLAQSNRIIFSKTQRHLLINFVEHTKLYFQKNQLQIPTFSINDSTNYITVRFLEEEKLRNKHDLFSMFLFPSMSCIFLPKKKEKDWLAKRRQHRTATKIKQLSYLTRANCRLDKSMRDKSNHKYEKLNKYINNQYSKSALEFVCHDEKFFNHILRLIYYHNNGSIKLGKCIKSQASLSFLDNFNENFVTYFDKQLKRTCAAVLIQKFWKRHWNNKKAAIPVFREITKQRAANKLQRFCRDMEFRHRISFDKDLSHMLLSIKEPVLYLHADTYFRINEYKSKKPLYKGLRLWANFTIKDLMLTWKKEKKVIFPLNRARFKQEDYEQSDLIHPADMHHVLHLNSQVSIVTGATVPSDSAGSKYFGFRFQSVEQAKKRAAYLALLTYRYKGNGFFVRMFTKQQIENPIVIKKQRDKFRQVYNKSEDYNFSDNLNWSENRNIPTPKCNFITKSKNIDPYLSAKLDPNHIFKVEFYQHQNIQTAPVKIEQTLAAKVDFGTNFTKNNSAAAVTTGVITPKTQFLSYRAVQNSEIGPSFQNKTTRRTPKFQADPSMGNKVSSKKLSLYDISYLPDTAPNRLRHTLKILQMEDQINPYEPEIIQNTFKVDGFGAEDSRNSTMRSNQTIQEMKRKHIQTCKETFHERRRSQLEKDKLEKTRMRKLYTQEKTRLIQQKYTHETQEYSINKLKVQRIEEIKKNKEKEKKELEAHEKSFLQKGNFLMKQEFRMNMIRRNYQEEENKRKSVSKKSVVANQHRSSAIRSKRVSLCTFSEEHSQNKLHSSSINDFEQQMSLEADNDAKELEQQGTIFNNIDERRIQAQSLADQASRTNSVMNTERNPTPEPSFIAGAGREAAMLNQISRTVIMDKSYAKLKKKRDKIIHGVFPEEYFAIQKKSNVLELPKLF